MNSEYRKGFVLTLLGVLIFTPDALLIRLTNIEFYSLTVGRGMIGGLAMLLGLALYYRRDFKLTTSTRNRKSSDLSGRVAVVTGGNGL